MGGYRFQARGGAGGAVHVVERAAAAAHDVVMVVPDAALVARRVPGGLDPPDKTDLGQGPQHVVYGLHGDVRQRSAHLREDAERVGVGEQCDRFEDRDAGPGHPQAVPPKDPWIGHTKTVPPLLEPFK